MLRWVSLFAFIPVFVLSQNTPMRVESVEGKVWLVVGKKREKLAVGPIAYGSQVVCERGAKAVVVMPEGSKAILLPPPMGCVRTFATFRKTSSDRFSVYLHEGALKALFVTTRFCVVAGGMFAVEPNSDKARAGAKYIAEAMVRVVRMKEKRWWFVFAVAGDIKVSLGGSGASVVVPEDEVALLRFDGEKRRWEVKADEANEKSIVVQGRDGKKREVAPEESVEICADRREKDYGLIVPPPPPPEALLLREKKLPLPTKEPYEEAGEVLEAPYVTPKKP